jgi:hypothetical protein
MRTGVMQQIAEQQRGQATTAPAATRENQNDE